MFLTSLSVYFSWMRRLQPPTLINWEWSSPSYQRNRPSTWACPKKDPSNRTIIATEPPSSQRKRRSGQSGAGVLVGGSLILGVVSVIEEWFPTPTHYQKSAVDGFNQLDWSLNPFLLCCVHVGPEPVRIHLSEPSLHKWFHLKVMISSWTLGFCRGFYFYGYRFISASPTLLPESTAASPSWSALLWNVCCGCL